MATTPPGQPDGRPIVFLLDCDNTLLDNDAVKADLEALLARELGEALAARFWREYEVVRALTGVVDIPLTFARLREWGAPAVPLDQAERAVMDYPFERRLYPETPAALAALERIGLAAVLSDGDQVYQRRKIERSGLAAAVDGRVLIYSHKEGHLTEVMARWPGSFYAMVDDKGRILAEIKRRYPTQFVTVHVRQGHYAPQRYDPAPDFTMAGIGGLLELTPEALARAWRPA